MSFDKKFILKAGSYSTLELVGNQGLGMLTFFILVRVLTKDDFGVWVLYLTSITMIEMARVGFVKNALIKYVGGDKDNDHIRSTSLYIGIFTFIVTTLLVQLPLAFLVGPVIWDAPILRDLFLLNIPASLLLVFYSHYKNIQQANLNFKQSLYCALFRRLPMLVSIVLLLFIWGEVDLTSLVIIQIGSIALATLVAYTMVRKSINLKIRFDRHWFTKLVRFGKYTFGTNLNAMILRNIDQFMLGSFFASFMVAVYNTAIRITNLVEIPINAMSTILYPKSAASSDDKRKLKEMYEKSVSLILFLVIPIISVIYVFPELFIYIVAGKEYYSAIPFLKVTLLFALVVPFVRQAGTILDSMGKPKINFYLTLFASVLNVSINYLFIGLFGAIGAAYGTLMSYCIILVVNQVFLYRFLNVSILSIITQMAGYYKNLVFMVLGKRKSVL